MLPVNDSRLDWRLPYFRNKNRTKTQAQYDSFMGTTPFDGIFLDGYGPVLPLFWVIQCGTWMLARTAPA
jgi:hypothetical protein